MPEDEGQLSRDELDKLMADGENKGADAETESTDTPAEPGEDTGEDAATGQEELDNLTESIPGGDADVGDAPEEGESGALSQDELDNLAQSIDGTEGGEEDKKQGEPGDDASEEDMPGDFNLPELDEEEEPAGEMKGLDMLMDVQLDVKIELGRTNMLVEDVLKLTSGSVVELDKLAGDPVDVLVNDRLIAKGEIVVLDDNFCVRIVEVLPKDKEDAD